MSEYVRPLPAGTTVTQAFGSNPSNGNNPPGGHTGTDYAVPGGTPVVAIADGVVEFEGWLSGTYADNDWWLVPEFAGICAVIDHGDGRPDAVYGHLSATYVNAGETVRQGQIIGAVGKTGKATGDHLHFEVLPPGYVLDGPTYGRVDPELYLAGAGAQAATTVRLPASVDHWNVYPLDVAPVQGNQLAALNPAQFGGLTYAIKGWTGPRVAIIDTAYFGRVQIYVGPDTPAILA